MWNLRGRGECGGVYRRYLAIIFSSSRLSLHVLRRTSLTASWCKVIHSVVMVSVRADRFSWMTHGLSLWDINTHSVRSHKSGWTLINTGIHALRGGLSDSRHLCPFSSCVKRLQQKATVGFESCTSCISCLHCETIEHKTPQWECLIVCYWSSRCSVFTFSLTGMFCLCFLKCKHGLVSLVSASGKIFTWVNFGPN